MRAQRVQSLQVADTVEGFPGAGPRATPNEHVLPEAGKGANALQGTFPN